MWGMGSTGSGGDWVVRDQARVLESRGRKGERRTCGGLRSRSKNKGGVDEEYVGANLSKEVAKM